MKRKFQEKSSDREKEGNLDREQTTSTRVFKRGKKMWYCRCAAVKKGRFLKVVSSLYCIRKEKGIAPRKRVEAWPSFEKGRGSAQTQPA